MANTDWGQISQRTAAWAASEMLKHAEPILVLSKFGLTKPIPKNTAAGAKFRAPVPFTVSTSALTEGVTPTEQQMSYVDVSVSLSQYGQVTIITDKVDDLAEDPVLKDAAELSGEQAAETKEMLLYGTLKAATNAFFTNGTARTAVNTAIALSDIRAITRSLKAQRAKYITKKLSGSPNYDTEPVEGGFVGFAHTDMENDIRNITGFIPVAKYGSREVLCPEEIGTIESVRFILSPLLEPWIDGGGDKGTMVSTTGTKADVYPLIVVGKNAYGHMPLKGANSIVPSVINPGTISKSDPLGQRGYVGWKTWDANAILNQAWMAKLEAGVTAL